MHMQMNVNTIFTTDAQLPFKRKDVKEKHSRYGMHYKVLTDITKF